MTLVFDLTPATICRAGDINVIWNTPEAWLLMRIYHIIGNTRRALYKHNIHTGQTCTYS